MADDLFADLGYQVTELPPPPKGAGKEAQWNVVKGGPRSDPEPALFTVEREPYHIDPLPEILARDNGLTAVSTFSGCGGSSMGLHMAGWRIPYAVEFIPSAREVYELNFPGTYVDPRDIREITPDAILDRLGMVPGELDLFEGSPPCSSFSVVNNVSKTAQFGGAKLKNYSDGVKQVTDDLFLEWIRLVAGLMPKTLLAENVPGLLAEKVRPFWQSIINALQDLGYIVDAGLYNANHYGAATQRRRLILRGIRRDVGTALPRPERHRHGFSIRDALDALPIPLPQDELDYARRSADYGIGDAWAMMKPGEQHGWHHNLYRCDHDMPLPGITAGGGGTGNGDPMHGYECRKFTPTELAWMFGYPAEFRLTGKPVQRYERIGRSVAPPLYEAHGSVLADLLGGRDDRK